MCVCVCVCDLCVRELQRKKQIGRETLKEGMVSVNWLASQNGLAAAREMEHVPRHGQALVLSRSGPNRLLYVGQVTHTGGLCHTQHTQESEKFKPGASTTHDTQCLPKSMASCQKHGTA